jgi:hypothetical protein
MSAVLTGMVLASVAGSSAQRNDAIIMNDLSFCSIVNSMSLAPFYPNEKKSLSARRQCVYKDIEPDDKQKQN